MTKYDYREMLEEQEIYELIGEERMEDMRQRQIQVLLDSYIDSTEDELNGMDDAELFGDEALEELRQRSIDEMVDAHEEDLDQ